MENGTVHKNIKICYAASSGGHLAEVMKIKASLEEKGYAGFVITEKTGFSAEEGAGPFYYLLQVNRRQKSCLLRLTANAFRSLSILAKEKPDIVICTGALAVIPVCLLAKISGKKLVFVESSAAIQEPTRTGRFLYRYADRFYIQWESLEKYYPDARYLGGIY